MLRRTFFLSTAASAVLVTFRHQLSFAKGAPTVTSDPLLAPWTGKYGGFPRFDKIKGKDFKPALTKAMDLFRAELDAIATAKDAPTFANTAVAFENAGREFNRANQIFSIFRSTMNDKPMQKLEEEMAPILSAFNDEIVQNEALFARIKAVYLAEQTGSKLAPDEQRLLEVQYKGFARQGAALSAKDKARMKEINSRLASLYTKFSQNELARRGELHARPRQGGGPRGSPRPGQGRREGRRRCEEGQGLAVLEHPLLDGAVPDVLVAPRPAREGLADVGQPW